MASDTAACPGPDWPDRQVTEREARFWPGLPLLAAGIAALVAGVVLAVVGSHQGHGTAVALIVLAVLLFIGSGLVFGGLTPVVPGQARVDQLFGRYRGTIRDSGLQWVNRFTAASRSRPGSEPGISAGEGRRRRRQPDRDCRRGRLAGRRHRQRHLLRDDYTQFVTIQTETAVRHIASSYPYTSSREGELSLRGGAEEITSRLSAEITTRVASAGVHIIESRLTRLSYAPEIAQAMLRQQQASAVVGARQRIVEGAVGMVELALQRLEEEGVVELDEERKATMVSNLLVCAESRPPSRSSTPAPSTSDGSPDYRHGTAVTERKSVLLRLDPAVHDALARWASRRAAQHQRPDRVPAPPRARRRRAAARPRRTDAAPRAATRR